MKIITNYLGILVLGFFFVGNELKAENGVPLKVYNPLPIEHNVMVTDILTGNDIPTGDGGFARDYYINLRRGEQIVIDLTSDEFDTIVTLMKEDGTTIGENDDAPDGTTNSLLFTRIMEDGKYIIRVSAFAVTGTGRFNLQVTKLEKAD